MGPHLADELVLPLALAGEGALRTMPITRHTETNVDIVQRFLSVRIRYQTEDRGTVRVELAGS